MKKMKFVLISFVLVVCFSACSKDDVGSREEESSLTSEEKINVELGKQAAQILAEVSQDEDVRVEILETIKKIKELNNVRDESVFFEELLVDNYNYILNKESSLSKAFYASAESIFDSKAQTQEFIDGLIENYLQIYFPYHDDFNFPDAFTVSYQNYIDWDENIGFLLENGKPTDVLLNEEYAVLNPSLIVGKFDNPYTMCLAPKDDLVNCDSSESVESLIEKINLIYQKESHLKNQIHY